MGAPPVVRSGAFRWWVNQRQAIDACRQPPLGVQVSSVQGLPSSQFDPVAVQQEVPQLVGRREPPAGEDVVGAKASFCTDTAICATATTPRKHTKTTVSAPAPAAVAVKAKGKLSDEARRTIFQGN